MQCRGEGIYAIHHPSLPPYRLFFLRCVPSPFTHLLPSLSLFTLLFLDYTYNVIFQFTAFHRLYIFFQFADSECNYEKFDR